MIRPANTLDAGAVGQLLTDGVGGFDWMPRLHSAAEDVAHASQMIARGWVHVVQIERQIAGFVARENAMIHALYVRQDQRGAGLGASLLELVKAQARHLELWTFQANTGAQRFYERNGFSEAERTAGDGNDEKLPDIRYIWRANEDAAI